MTDIRLYNTLTRQKEVFAPADPKRVTMYVCGPTVYNRAHIGNARPAVVFDVLARLLRHKYGADSVIYARNITDIEDKIIESAAAKGVPIDTITSRYERHYLDDMGALGVQPPDRAPHATHHIGGMIAMIARLIERGHAYTADGHVLFDVPSWPDYGRLSRRPMDEMIAGARVEVAPYKKSPADFVLWKPSSDAQPGWDSPWGRGRPGWHIECSAMIAAELGETIDIHAGGIDLQFPHHENEIAQSECAHAGAPLAKMWLHNGFLDMRGEKMSKSLGNVTLVDGLLADGHKGETLRLALLTAHYRKPLDWTESVVRNSRKLLDRLYEARGDGPWKAVDPPDNLVQALNDDLNTPEAIAILSGLARDRRSDVLNASGSLLGLFWESRRERKQGTNSVPIETARMAPTGQEIQLPLIGAESRVYEPTLVKHVLTPAQVEERIAARTAARARRDWAESDRIRDELAAEAIVLEDGPSGTTWRRA